ncbi:unnamed protein product [Moneuplotes crassus]|uniref:Uncharacterized protein n=1 Tax=Euplotes crassus TaxID=5936 RepID=A0AAD1XCE2_EUPCR|nr:unnamed protein product [Moneuplotes crassus]
MLSTEFNFQYNQLFPQWDFSTDYEELLQFSEKYGTVDHELGNDPQLNISSCETEEDVISEQLHKASIKSKYSLRKNPRRKLKCFLGESTLKLRNTLDPSLFSSERGKYSMRKDIVCKTILRAIRRFYRNIFRAKNHYLFVWRIVDVPEEELTKAVNNMCAELFSPEIIDKYELNEFIQTFLDLKVSSKKKVMKRSENAIHALKCCKNFSLSGFNKFRNDPCFQNICLKICIDFEKEFLATLRISKQNLDKYRRVLRSLCS